MTELHSPEENNLQQLITEHIDLWTGAVKDKSSAGRGSSSKRELYGIKKLRELILELAVRGKLVAQDSNDEPASVLLERIAAEKAELVKQGKIKKPKKLPEISEEEKPFELPDGWGWSRINELSKQVTDGVHHTPKYLDAGIPFISVKDISGKTIVFDDCKYISEEQHLEINKRCNPEKGDILLCRIGTLGRATIVDTERSFSLFVSVGLLKFFQHELQPEYTHLVLHSPCLLSQYESIKAGGSHTNKLNLGDIPKLLIPVSPLAEQHRIVAKVDELMALCDQLEQQTETSLDAHQTLVQTLLDTLLQSADTEELEQNWQRLSAHFDLLFTTEQSINQLKQTILQLAVMGKLVPQNPNDEPASELLKRIAAEKEELAKQKKIKKQKPLPPISDDEKPFQLPKGWEWCRLPEVGDLARGKSKHRPRNDPSLYIDGTIPLVQTGDVARSNGEINTFSAQYNEMGLKQSQLWPKGTLCITIAANIADTGILGFDACFPDSVVGFSVSDERLSVNYFDYFIRTAKANLEKFAPSTAQKNINLEILSSLLVPCPAVREHSLIVAKVDQLMAHCDQLKAKLADSKTTQLNLTDALVDGATA
ncbi:restriction endonuclease subunit S [Marinomonas gallaica]|uniref:restriction endonuclease subunit S n=1 Tax=Marinomonas gallaica TaxID=1806667 RepID=UPI003A92F563